MNIYEILTVLAAYQRIGGMDKTNLTTVPAPLHSEIVKGFIVIEEQLFPDMDIMIAGGSVRKALVGEPLGTSDYDVFFKNKSEFTRAVEYMMANNIQVARHPNCASFTINKYNQLVKLPGESLYIQLIDKEWHDSVESLMSSFDFTVCQFAYKNQKISYPVSALQDHYDNKLAFTPEYSAGERNASEVRTCKYMAMGYTPSQEVFEKVLIGDRETLKAGDLDLTGYDELYGEL